MRSTLGILVACLGASACTAIIGVSDLPAANSSDAGGHDGGARDATSPDSGRRDATGAEASHADAARTDASPPDASIDAQPVRDASDAGDATLHDAEPDVPLPAFAVSPGSLAFGDAGGKLGFIACGQAGAPTRQLTLRNTTAQPFAWSASLGLGAGSPYVLASSCLPSSPCTLEPGDAGTTVVTITGPVVSADAGAQTYGDTLTLFSNAPDAGTVSIALTAASYGSILEFSQSNVAFGTQPANQPDGGYPQVLQLENNGNAPFTGDLTLRSSVDAAADATATRFLVTRIGDASVAPDATLIEVPGSKEAPFTVSFEPEGSAREAGAALFVGPSGTNVLCAPLPAPVALTGEGTTSPVSVSPATVNFNANQNNGSGVSCGTAGLPATVTVTNTSFVAGQITSLSLSAGNFTVPTAPIAVPAATGSGPGVATFVITPKAIPLSAFPGDTYGDTLTIHTSLAGDKPHSVPLQMAAAGALLSIPQSTVAIAPAAAGSNGSASIWVTNQGNVPAQLMTTSSNSAFRWNAAAIDPLMAREVDLTFSAPAGQLEHSTASTTLFVPATTPVCGSSSRTFTQSVSGDGYPTFYRQIDAPQAAVSLNATCPSAAAAATVSTTGTKFVLLPDRDTNFPITWSATLAGPDAAFFDLNETSGALASATDSATIVLTQKLLVTASPSLSFTQAGFGLNAYVVLTTSDAAAPPYTGTATIPIWEQVRGGYFAWAQSAVVVPAQASTALTLYDWSLGSNSVTLASSTPLFALQSSGGSAVDDHPLTVTLVDNGASGTTMGTVTASIGQMTPLCAPLPAPINVSRGP